MKMEITRTARRISHEIDDVLATAPLVRGNQSLADELYEHLVDLLLQSILVDLARRHEDGVVNDDDYAAELVAFAHQCRAVGLTGTP
jgi:hypothetical protein